MFPPPPPPPLIIPLYVFVPGVLLFLAARLYNKTSLAFLPPSQTTTRITQYIFECTSSDRPLYQFAHLSRVQEVDFPENLCR